MAKHFDSMEDSNRSGNPSIHDVSDPARRTVLRGSAVLGVASLLAPLATALGGCATAGAGPTAARATLGFKGVHTDAGDRLVVPEGYVATVIAAWGEPVGVPGQMPAFRHDGSNSAADQAVQMGMHHDGLAYYPLDGSRRGLLAMNHEYTDDGLLHADGMRTWSAEKVKKSLAAHGLSVIEVEQRDGNWQMVRPSRYARRVTMETPFAVGGPAAGHALMKTAADPDGRRVLGTLNNCASAATPWGTYLSGEENFAFYFNAGDTPTPHERRWGLRKGGTGYRWHEHEERFDTTKHPNEPTASAGWSSSTRWTRPARRSSAPRSGAPPTRAPGSRSPRTSVRSSTPARTRASNTSTSSSRATASGRPATA
jgi:hypothetical protein